MTDYTQNTFFAPKDALLPLDPDKLILGAELDPELLEIQTAIATKYDSTDIATEAQAEAGVSNTTLMTPLRVAQLLGDAGGGGAGIVPDLIALTDPGDDRIIFWDESIDSAAFLDIGSHLETTAGAVLNVTEGTIDHDALTNFVADEHVAHAGVTITAGVGLSYSVGGTNISASATIDLDINELASETTLDLTNDFAVFYDASALTEVKIPLENFVGIQLGDGKWFRNAVQALSAATETTIAFNGEEYDSLELGSFNVSTGQYTRGSTAGRVQVVAQIHFPLMAEADDAYVNIEVNGVEKARGLVTNRGQFGASSSTALAFANLSLAAADVVQVRAFNDSGISISAGTENSFVNVTELS